MSKPPTKFKVRPRKSVPAADEPAHKLRYKFKEGFAAKVKDRSLKTYRAQKGKEFELTGNTVLRSINSVEDVAETLLVTNNETGNSFKANVVRLTILAKLLNTSYQSIWRWVSETKLLPEPILVETSKGRERLVYHVDEVRVMVRAIGEHLNRFKYYRQDHTGTRDRIFSEIETIRSNNYGVQSNGTGKSTGQSSGKVRKITRSRSA